MGLVDKIASLWSEESTVPVHGWVETVDGAAVPVDTTPPGSRYVELIVTEFGLRFQKERTAGRRPVFASAVTWKSPDGDDVHISKTLSDEDFAAIGAAGADVAVHRNVALTPLLPLGSNNVEFTVGLLSAPGSSLFDGIASFLGSVAELTQRPELTAVGAVADRVATGLDSILGNTEVTGRVGLHTSVLATQPRSGYYLVTSLDGTTTPIAHFTIVDGRLQHWSKNAWQAPSGFDYLLVQVAIRGSQPDRWRDIQSIAGPWKAADEKLAHATTPEAVTEAGVSFRLAVVNARNDPNLSVGDRDLAAEEIRQRWQATAKDAFGPGAGGASGFVDAAAADELLALTRSIAERTEA